MTKEKVSFRKLFWASLIFLIAFFSLIPTLSFAEDTSIDVGSVGSGSAVSHTHIYQTFYDEHYHWQQLLQGDREGVRQIGSSFHLF